MDEKEAFICAKESELGSLLPLKRNFRTQQCPAFEYHGPRLYLMVFRTIVVTFGTYRKG
jgi:hypothetical protein